MRFKVLGPLEIYLPNGKVIAPSSAKICKVLGVLLVREEVSSVDLLVQELWGDDPPRSALTTLQTYIYHSRRMFDREAAGEDWQLPLITRPPGYQLNVDEEQVDAKVFARLVKQGQLMLDRGRTDEAAARLRQALALWRGPALANVPAGVVLCGYITHLEELRIRAIELRIEAEGRLGRRRDLIPELRSLVTSYPLNEWFHLQLIDALHHSGRRAEALLAYQDLRRILDDELGVEPTAEAQQLQRQVLMSA